ncbi:hypothetical protein C7T94_09880 [Pedobacter yulinensis]|uniref:DUF3347 domain-containing protein n=1 Tax=Pedobacter yulinensis TaxID=2126353 RepID=A0A2T3HKL7_9SPHI|nr:DUF3347 domain-containing protein [Pedobacter yulinensis]PST82931.1 hypothetical protein C7T94_09880 [Pedobacter yulinensis]
MRKLLMFASCLAIFACGNSKQEHADAHTEKKENTVPVAEVPVKMKDIQVQNAYTQYIRLKDALVSSNFEAAREASVGLQPELKPIAGCETAQSLNAKISEAKTLAEQRKHFTSLSEDMIGLFKNATLVTGKIYVQHCPMANNGDGGDWLSSDEKIQNPYYGDEMLECGNILEEIKAK